MILEDFVKEFKFFKTIYQQINIAEEITFIATDNKVDLLFSRDSTFYILKGSIEAESQFLNWIKENNISATISLEDISIIQKVLNKDMIGIEYDKDYFTFKYKEKGTNNELSIIIKPVQVNNKEFCFNHSLELNESDLSTDVLEIFLNGNEATRTPTKRKLIEIANTKLSIKSLLKSVKQTEGKGKDKIEKVIEPVNIIKWSDDNELGQKYVGIESSIDCNDYKLSLIQISLTI